MGEVADFEDDIYVDKIPRDAFSIRARMTMTHDCVFWHYYITGAGLVWDNPFEPCPDEYFSEGYACQECGGRSP